MKTAYNMKTLILIFSITLAITNVQCQTTECSESYKIDNQVCIDDIKGVSEVSEVISKLSDIEFEQTYIEDIVGDRIFLEGEGIKILYTDYGAPGFLMSVMDITSNQHFLYDTINEIEIRVGQRKTEEIINSLGYMSKEFRHYSIEIDNNEIITKIRVSFRYT